jgi:hypothetical protein
LGRFPLDAEEAECWVDEDGEDEWCWEYQFKPERGTKVNPPLLSAIEPMYFVAAAGTTVSARILQEWAPLSSLRPHWLWKGAEEGWVVGADAMVSVRSLLYSNSRPCHSREPAI